MIQDLLTPSIGENVDHQDKQAEAKTNPCLRGLAAPDAQIPVLVTTPQHPRVDFQSEENESLLIQGTLIEKQSEEMATPKTADFSKKKISLPFEEPLDIKHSHHQRSGWQRIESPSVIILDPVENMISTQKIEKFQRERKQSVRPVEEKNRSPYPARRSSWSQRTLQSILENPSNSIERNLKPAYEKANNLMDKLYVIQYAVGHFWQQALCLTRWSTYPVEQHPLSNLNAWNQKFLILLQECSHRKDRLSIIEQTQKFWANLLLQKQPHHNRAAFAVGIAQLEFWKQYPRSTQVPGVAPSSSVEDMKRPITLLLILWEWHSKKKLRLLSN
jgi:hypothetical protein